MANYASDGGLSVPEYVPQVSRTTLRNWSRLSVALQQNLRKSKAPQCQGTDFVECQWDQHGVLAYVWKHGVAVRKTLYQNQTVCDRVRKIARTLLTRIDGHYAGGFLFGIQRFTANEPSSPSAKDVKIYLLDMKTASYSLTMQTANIMRKFGVKDKFALLTTLGLNSAASFGDIPAEMLFSLDTAVGIYVHSFDASQRGEAVLSIFADDEADAVRRLDALSKLKAFDAQSDAVRAERYAAAMSSSVEHMCAVEGLAERHTFSAHKKDKADPMSVNQKKMMKEIRKDLPRNLFLSHSHGSMFVRFEESNPRFLQAMLIGVGDTPYQDGCFLFDVYLCDAYPQKPPEMKHVTYGATQCHANNGPGGFSPNLHQTTGKVCLSLLGTWAGPGWEANKSNVYQILSTLLLMVFGAEHPYYMEPNHGGWEGTALAKTTHDAKVIEYDAEVLYHTAKSAMLGVLVKPYVGFEDVIRCHFKCKASEILQRMETVCNDEQYGEAFRRKIEPVYQRIKSELNKL